jgi:hypothetical protein
MPVYFPNFEKCFGILITNEMLKYARQGKFKNGEEFAGHLDKTIKEEDDRHVQGNFLYRKTRNDFLPGEEAMKDILSDWSEKYEVIDTKTTVHILVTALNSAKMKDLGSEIKRIFEEENRQNSQKSDPPQGSEENERSKILPSSQSNQINTANFR